MKLNFLKLKRNSLPSLKSLRPPIFNVESFWFAGLGLCLIIFVITALIGFNLFYSQYFESYKKLESSENYEDIINTNRLKGAIEKRNNFINREIFLPQDPSL
jgi:hypothetical protein